MLLQRIIAGSILFPVCAAILWYGGWLATSVLLVVHTLVNYEYYSFASTLGQHRRLQFTAASLLLPIGFLIYGFPGLLGGFVIAVILGFCISLVLIESERHQPDYVSFVPAIFLGLCYTGLFGALMVAASRPEHGSRLMLWLMAVAVASDTLAFFGGRSIGRRPLAERISPNKTLGGAVCGLVGAFVVGVCLGMYFEFQSSLAMLAVYSFLAGILAQIGDLAESLIKRIYQVKDAGALIPGHGGLLDRVDSFLLSCPILYFMNVL